MQRVRTAKTGRKREQARAHAYRVIGEHQTKFAEAALAVGVTLPIDVCDCDLCGAAARLLWG